MGFGEEEGRVWRGGGRELDDLGESEGGHITYSKTRDGSLSSRLDNLLYQPPLKMIAFSAAVALITPSASIDLVVEAAG